MHNGKPIELANPNPRRTVTSNSITIVNLTKQDTGNYGCNASSERVDGYVYKDVFINVLALPPEITTPPSKMLRTVTGSEVRYTYNPVDPGSLQPKRRLNKHNWP